MRGVKTYIFMALLYNVYLKRSAKDKIVNLEKLGVLKEITSMYMFVCINIELIMKLAKFKRYIWIKG